MQKPLPHQPTQKPAVTRRKRQHHFCTTAHQQHDCKQHNHRHTYCTTITKVQSGSSSAQPAPAEPHAANLQQARYLTHAATCRRCRGAGHRPAEHRPNNRYNNCPSSLTPHILHKTKTTCQTTPLHAANPSEKSQKNHSHSLLKNMRLLRCSACCALHVPMLLVQCSVKATAALRQETRWCSCVSHPKPAVKPYKAFGTSLSCILLQLLCRCQLLAVLHGRQAYPQHRHLVHHEAAQSQAQLPGVHS